MDWASLDSIRGRKYQTVANQIEESEVKYATYTFPASRSHQTVELMHLTDLQYGSVAFKAERFKEYCDWLLSRPNRYVFLGGDIIDAATVLSVGSPHENTGDPLSQYRGVIQLLQPLAKAHRLLGYVGGNHERRTAKTWGDSGSLIAEALSVPYSRGVQLIDINYGDHHPFKVSLWHGGGAARTKGAKAQMLHRFMQQADSQIYLVGHLHDSLLLFDWRQTRAGRRIKLQKIAGVMSSSFQAYWNTYAETYAMSPSDTMMARIILDPDGGWEVTLR
jgi:predicted MPP superfamily phosphohydrolase